MKPIFLNKVEICYKLSLKISKYVTLREHISIWTSYISSAQQPYVTRSNAKGTCRFTELLPYFPHRRSMKLGGLLQRTQGTDTNPYLKCNFTQLTSVQFYFT
jgi:hypothetical protein